MALNRHRPHLLVLPEDDATRSLANGFVDGSTGPMQVLVPVRGWPHVLEEFKRTYMDHLRKYGQGHIVLLIDFDDDFPNRLAQFQSQMPADVADRVYVLGALTEAETLQRQTGKKLGPLGTALARECSDGTQTLWNCPQLQHNQQELARLTLQVKPFLF